MFKDLSRLVMYRELGRDSIITKLGEIIREFDSREYDKENLVSRIYEEIHKLLKVATSYGFDRNLWQDYVTFVLMTNENPFSLTCERKVAEDGSVSSFVLHDMEIFI